MPRLKLTLTVTLIHTIMTMAIAVIDTHIRTATAMDTITET